MFLKGESFFTQRWFVKYLSKIQIFYQLVKLGAHISSVRQKDFWTSYLPFTQNYGILSIFRWLWRQCACRKASCQTPLLSCWVKIELVPSKAGVLQICKHPPISKHMNIKMWMQQHFLWVPCLFKTCHWGL